MREKAVTFPRRRFLHLAGLGAALLAMPKIASARSFPTRIGDLMIIPNTCGVMINGRVCLTSREYKLLKLLWRNKGNTIGRKIILKHLYSGTDEPEPKIIDVFIAMLRFKVFKATDGNGSIKIDAVADDDYVLTSSA